MPNFADSFYFYEKNRSVVDAFNYTTDAQVQAIYTEGGDGGNPVIKEVDEAPLLKVGETSTQFPITHSTGTSTWTADATFFGQDTDVSELVGVSNGVPTQGKIRMLFKRSSTTAITAISIRYGSDSSNYVTWTPTLPSTTNQVALEDNLSGLSATGTPDWTDADYIQVRATSASGTPTIDLSGLEIVVNNDVTDNVWEETSDQATNGKSLYWLSLRNSEAAILHAEGSSDQLFNYAKSKKDGFTYSGRYTEVAKVKWQDNTSGNDVGVCFNMSDITSGSENGYIAYFDTNSDTIELARLDSGSASVLETYTVSAGLSEDTQYWIKVESLGSGRFRILYSANGQSYNSAIDYTDATYTSGRVGTYVGGTPVAEVFSFEAYSMPYVKFGGWSFHERNMVKLDSISDYSAPSRDINILDIATSNKSKYLSDYYRSKFVNVSGKIIADTPEDLVCSIDDLKRNLSKSNTTLTIAKETESLGVFKERTYDSAIAINLDDIQSDYKHRYFLPFSVTFQCPDGFASGNKTLSISTASTATSSLSQEVFFQGNAAPLPTLTVTLTDATPSSGANLDTVVITNTRNNERLTINATSTFSDGDVVTVDFASSRVSNNGQPIEYTGLASDNFFEPGRNLLRYEFSRVNNIAVANGAPTGSSHESENKYETLPVAQSFTVASTTTYPRFDVYMKAIDEGGGLDGAEATIRIETNSSNEPSGTLVNAGATATVPASNTNYQFVSFELDTAASLSASTLYWMVVVPGGQTFTGLGLGIDPSYAHRFKGTRDNTYTNGGYKADNDSSTSRNWFTPNSGYDLSFKIYLPDLSGLDVDVDISYTPRFI